MKGNRINFFQSPNPQHFNTNLLEESRQQNPEDHQIYQERLLCTPVRLNRPLLTSPSPQMDVHLISSQPRARSSPDIFGDQAVEILNQQQLQSYNRTIKQRVEYSEEEDLLNHLTPAKLQKVENYPQQLTTVKRPVSTPITPLQQSRSSERGLKKLASEAFRFVNMQKRTTYKQVAKKLIGDLGEDGDLDPNVPQYYTKKKGQMNVKRRVYDALNVLIALGLLKRNGNKILGKRLDIDHTIGNKIMEKEKQRFKQQQMQRELSLLKTQFEKRRQSIKARKKHQRQIKLKIEKLRELVCKNTNTTEIESNQDYQANVQNRISFPLIMICQKGEKQEYLKQEIQKSMEEGGRENQEEQLQEEESQEQENSLKMWQETEENLFCHFNSAKLDLMGEMDLLLNWKGEEKTGRTRNLRIKRKPQ